ncbi:MAG TPA: hypothetical protein VJU59_38330 [Paraburkholderia sp.]|uniref:hypothetical protein n=1 Tax=Paraburkholderia sp. TaxID=1926495 RepID=UPI002B4AACBE|nr:hypothetical protein [Paraburkholderia sp.]HKR45467.1 hypothetical protein [Paraburkholderia sp.]
MKRITKDMVVRGGWRYCHMCSGPRVKAHWTHEGRDYCDEHKPTEAQISGEHPPSAAFIDYPHDWKHDAQEIAKRRQP